jgi:hypothetical protein
VSLARYKFTREPVSTPVIVKVGVVFFVYVVPLTVAPPSKVGASGASGAVVSRVKVKAVPAELVPAFSPTAIVTFAVKL